MAMSLLVRDSRKRVEEGQQQLAELADEAATVGAFANPVEASVAAM